MTCGHPSFAHHPLLAARTCSRSRFKRKMWRSRQLNASCGPAGCRQRGTSKRNIGGSDIRLPKWSFSRIFKSDL